MVAVIAIAASAPPGSPRSHLATARFNSCIDSQPLLSATGAPVVNGANEFVVDQLHGIVANVLLFSSNAQANSGADTLTSYPVRIVRGSYMVGVNHGVGKLDTLAIETCASDLPGSGAPQRANAVAPTTAIKTCHIAVNTRGPIDDRFVPWAGLVVSGMSCSAAIAAVQAGHLNPAFHTPGFSCTSSEHGYEISCSGASGSFTWAWAT